ncbi:MAG: Histidinol-phosphate aminotransferase (EC [uncultured Caballeronia sp.]|nr:MAG: Histidinol-phosphate aminotransferase (EC [uncultured Caballeronia sp.]
MHPLLANCVRLTVGSAQENAQMIAVLKLALHGNLLKASKETPCALRKSFVTPAKRRSV